jgi:Pyruvate/2-oxoacid:ferredoxin oxidoreductase delta subunit
MAERMTPKRSAPRLPAIDVDRCTGCGRCVAACPPRVLSLETTNWRKSAHLHGRVDCTGCGLCEGVCPFHAITMVRPARVASSHDPG